jgi:uncharacterized RDD family membrane protein YckC
MSTTEQALAARPAPLHRRALAFLIDLTIIGAPAGAVGRLMFDPLSDLGEYGRLIGAVLVALYFGYFDSRLGGGRSPGKRWLGLQVVSLTSGLLPPARAAARALIVTTPTLLNGVTVDAMLAPMAELLIIGLGLSLTYLAIFNRPSHRSLHDLATAALVVRLTAELPTALPMHRFRWAVLLALLAMAAPVVLAAPIAGLLIIGLVLLLAYLAATFNRRALHDLANAAIVVPAVPPMGRLHSALAVLALVVPGLLFQAVDSWADFNEAESIGQRVEMLPGVRSAHVTVSWKRKTSQASRDMQVIVVADLREWPADRSPTANAVATAIYRGTERLIADAPVTVRLRRSFTLGIAHETQSEKFPLDAKRWNAQRGT